MRFSARIALAVCVTLSLVACGHSSNVRTESAGTSAPANGMGPVVVPVGTTFYGKLQQEIDTKKSQDGDRFTLVQTDTALHKNPELHGSVVEGHLQNVQAAGIGRKPTLALVFDDIRMADGTTAPIDVQLVNVHAFDAKTHHLRTLGMMIGGAMAGGMAARATGKRHGALLGAAGGYILSQQMKTDVDVKPGTVLELRFLRSAHANTAGS